MIQSLLPDLPRHDEALRQMTLSDIALRRFNEYFTREFRRIVHVGREDPPKLIRLASIEGVPVDEAYVYRSI